MAQQLNGMEDFQRDISYRLVKQENGTAILTATLKDRYHDIEVRVTVDVATLAIASAEADFRKAPTSDCRNVAPKFKKLVGYAIGRGLQKKLAEVFGGAEGCGNMRTLLMGLLPLALNLQAAAGITDEQELLDAIHEKLLGSCAGYVTPPKKG